jgi:Flp pilus assembly protein TadG
VLRRLLHDRGGSVLLVLGLALPVLTMGAAATIEYAALTQQRMRLQKAADTAAVAAGKELGLANTTDSNIKSIARAVALASLSAGQSAADVSPATVSAEVFNQRRSVRVYVVQGVTGVLGKVMSLPTSELRATAAATLSGSSRLCVLALDPLLASTVQMEKNSLLTAPQCSVYSNSLSPLGLVVKDSARIVSERICTVGGYLGSALTFSTAPLTGCPGRTDPLSERVPPSIGPCDFTKLEVKGGVRTLTPGVYCEGLRITSAAQVSLSPGNYIITGRPLTVDGNSSLKGDYVGFYFRGDAALVDFKKDSTIDLSAPKTGPLAGILFFEDRSAPLLRAFKISSDNARRLLGTIYLSRGALMVDASKAVSDLSAYTVIVARQLHLKDGPNLYLNAMYTSSDVPVPDGVGPNGSAVSLSE